MNTRYSLLTFQLELNVIAQRAEAVQFRLVLGNGVGSHPAAARVLVEVAARVHAGVDGVQQTGRCHRRRA